MSALSRRLAELGHTLPAVEPPVANFLTSLQGGELLLTAGQIGRVGAAKAGPVGAGLSVEATRDEAQQAALHLLAAIDAALDGASERIEHVLRLGVFIAAAPGFDAHSRVADGASDLLVAALGERGRHVRTAIGVASLPAGAAVEVDALLRLRPASESTRP
ncbi:RidA family protein [Aquincola sp. S2]|uniref:RidA family protein n=1 Tax=Pseudaquabacterium terrae TaxID=2732868 RepID=A0ABX2ENS9_9BURK|nr:RidA family protein [Aquabacterium terrae]NRF70317.1 RidA family protein [Aquabacterium terrae]